jgi:hypothetical protein
MTDSMLSDGIFKVLINWHVNSKCDVCSSMLDNSKLVIVSNGYRNICLSCFVSSLEAERFIQEVTVETILQKWSTGKKPSVWINAICMYCGGYCSEKHLPVSVPALMIDDEIYCIHDKCREEAKKFYDNYVIKAVAMIM